MIFEMIGALSAGLGLMGIAMLIWWVLRLGPFPGWAYPATVAVGMVAFSVWAEYTWADRALEAQPQLRLADTTADPSPMRPFSYVRTPVNRFQAIDLSRTLVHPDQPDLVRTLVVSMARWEPVRAVEVVVDCEAHALAPIGGEARIGPDGALEGASWRPLHQEDRLLRAVCAAGEEIRHARGQGT
jgi:hypothetical protein